MAEVYVVMAEPWFGDATTMAIAVFSTLEEAQEFADDMTDKSSRYNYYVDDAKQQPTEVYKDFLVASYG